MKCKPCTADCKSCGPTGCTECLSKKSLVNGFCLSCSDNCEECSQGGCLVCKPDYALDESLCKVSYLVDYRLTQFYDPKSPFTFNFRLILEEIPLISHQTHLEFEKSITQYEDKLKIDLPAVQSPLQIEVSKVENDLNQYILRVTPSNSSSLEVGKKLEMVVESFSKSLDPAKTAKPIFYSLAKKTTKLEVEIFKLGIKELSPTAKSVSKVTGGTNDVSVSTALGIGLAFSVLSDDPEGVFLKFNQFLTMLKKVKLIGMFFGNSLQEFLENVCGGNQRATKTSQEESKETNQSKRVKKGKRARILEPNIGNSENFKIVERSQGSHSKLDAFDQSVFVEGAFMFKGFIYLISWIFKAVGLIFFRKMESSLKIVIWQLKYLKYHRKIHFALVMASVMDVYFFGSRVLLHRRSGGLVDFLAKGYSVVVLGLLCYDFSEIWIQTSSLKGSKQIGEFDEIEENKDQEGDNVDSGVIKRDKLASPEIEKKNKFGKKKKGFNRGYGPLAWPKGRKRQKKRKYKPRKSGRAIGILASHIRRSILEKSKNAEGGDSSMNDSLNFLNQSYQDLDDHDHHPLDTPPDSEESGVGSEQRLDKEELTDRRGGHSRSKHHKKTQKRKKNKKSHFKPKKFEKSGKKDKKKHKSKNGSEEKEVQGPGSKSKKSKENHRNQKKGRSDKPKLFIDVKKTLSYNSRNMEVEKFCVQHLDKNPKTFNSSICLLNNLFNVIHLAMMLMSIVALPHSPTILALSLLSLEVLFLLLTVIPYFCYHRFISVFEVASKITKSACLGGFFMVCIWIELSSSGRDIPISSNVQMTGMILIMLGILFNYLFTLIKIVLLVIGVVKAMIEKLKQKKQKEKVGQRDKGEGVEDLTKSLRGLVWYSEVDLSSESSKSLKKQDEAPPLQNPSGRDEGRPKWPKKSMKKKKKQKNHHHNHQRPFPRKVPHKSGFFQNKKEALKKKNNNKTKNSSPQDWKHSAEDLNGPWSSLNPRKRVRSYGGAGKNSLYKGIGLDRDFGAKLSSPGKKNLKGIRGLEGFGEDKDNQSVEFRRDGEVLLNYF